MARVSDRGTRTTTGDAELQSKRSTRPRRLKLASSEQARRFKPHVEDGLTLKLDPHPSPSIYTVRRTSLDSATTGDDRLVSDTSTVRSYVPSSPGDSESEGGRKSVSRRKLCQGIRASKKRYDRLTKTQLDVFYPPKHRASIGVLYRWMAELSPRERVRRAPYCFRDSDGLPRAHFKREFQVYEDRQVQAGRLDSPPDARMQRRLSDSFIRSATHGVDRSRSHSPSNAPVVLRKWKGKAREPSEDGGRIRMLEERAKFMEAATQEALDEVAKRQDFSIDKRIRWAVEPLRKGQRRLNDAVSPLKDQIQDLTTTVSREMEGLKNAVLSSRRLNSVDRFT